MGIATLIDGVFAVFFDRYLMPRLNLAALFLLGTLALTMTRVLSRRLATRRKGPSRVALVGDSSERDRARNTLASHISSARIVLECDSEFLDPLQVKEFEVTDVFFVDLSAFERNFPEPLTGLAQEGTTVIQRVSAAETLLGLKTVYNWRHSIHSSQHSRPSAHQRDSNASLTFRSFCWPARSGLRSSL